MTSINKVISHFKSADPKLYPLIKAMDYSPWINRKEKDYFVAICEDIVGQQLSGKAANAIWARFIKLFSLQLITPQKLIKLTDHQIRDIGTSWAKAKYLKDLAQQVIGKTVILDNLAELDDAQVIAEMTKVKGIGPWTAEMFLIFTLKRENVFSLGDLGLKNAVLKLYGPKGVTQKQLDSWSPYKTYASLALWRSLDNV